MPSRFGLRRRGRAKRQEFQETGIQNIAAGRMAPAVRPPEPAGTRARIKGIRQYAERQHTGHAEQIRRAQDIQAEQEKQAAFGRQQSLRQEKAQKEREQFGRRQTIARQLREEERLKLERRRIKLAEEEAKRRGKTAATKLSRPKAGVGPKAIGKKPSTSPDYYRNLLSRVNPEAGGMLVDDEGEFTDKGNLFLDSLDVYAQRNPGGNEDEALRFAAKAAGFKVPDAPKPPTQAEIDEFQKGGFMDLPSTRKPGRRVFSGINKATGVPFISTADDQIPRESPADIALNRRIAQSGLFDDEEDTQQARPRVGRFARPRTTPAEEGAEAGAAFTGAALAEEQEIPGKERQAIGPFDPRGTDAGQLPALGRPGSFGPFDPRGTTEPIVPATTAAAAALGQTPIGKFARGIDVATGGPQVRDRQRSMVTLDNARQVLRGGNVTGAEAQALRNTIIRVNRLMQKENLSETEQAQIDRAMKILQERYSR